MNYFESGPLAFFSKIYSEDYDEMGFDISSKPEFKKVHSTLKKFGMPTDNFEKNLTTLKLKKVSESGHTVASYLPKQNKLEYTDPYFILHELFHMASSTGSETTGISYRAKNNQVIGASLKEGITDMFCSLSDPNYEVLYPFEKFCAQTLDFIYGTEVFVPHFQNNPVQFLSQFKNQRDVMDLMAALDKYSENNEKVRINILEGKAPDGSSFDGLRFNVGKCLNLLAKIFYDTVGKDIDREVFKRFMINGLSSEEMRETLILLSRYNDIDLDKVMNEAVSSNNETSIHKK